MVCESDFQKKFASLFNIPGSSSSLSFFTDARKAVTSSSSFKTIRTTLSEPELDFRNRTMDEKIILAAFSGSCCKKPVPTAGNEILLHSFSDDCFKQLLIDFSISLGVAWTGATI